MEAEFSDTQKFVAAGLIELLFWGIFLYAGLIAGWIPAFPLFGLGVFLLNLLVLAAWYNLRQTESMPGFQTTTKQQLTEEEAYNLARYILAYRRGYRVDRVLDRGIDPAVSPSDDKEDAVRLFKFEFRPLNLSGRAVLYIDLEQELSVDIDDLDSLEKAADQVQNIRMVKSWAVESYADRVMDVKESLGRSVSPTITRITETDEGREIEEYPALPGRQNQGSSNTDSTEEEA